MQRRPFNPAPSLEEHLADEAERLRQKALVIRPGADRDAILTKARQAETGSHVSQWLRSSEHQPPTLPGLELVRVRLSRFKLKNFAGARPRPP